MPAYWQITPTAKWFHDKKRISIGERGASWQGHFLWIYLNFLTTRFANWMNESDSDFNFLWIDRIRLQCSFTRNCEIEKNCKKKSANLPQLRVSWQLTILHCSKIFRSNFENLQLSISLEIYVLRSTYEFYVISSLILFSLFYIYNSLNKIYSIIYQDPFVGGRIGHTASGLFGLHKIAYDSIKIIFRQLFSCF